MLLKIGQRADHGFDEPLGLLSDCHRRIERFLHILIAVTRDVADGELAATQRAQLEAALAYFATAAPRHTADEEESLFPRLKASGDAAATAALAVCEQLEREHDAASTHHRAVETIGRQWLSHGRLPETEVSHLEAHLSALQALYQAHIALEDGELFPLAARLLSARQLEEIGGEMAARRRRA
jgi:hemerythrin-like domain-containing protein